MNAVHVYYRNYLLVTQELLTCTAGTAHVYYMIFFRIVTFISCLVKHLPDDNKILLIYISHCLGALNLNVLNV